MTLNNSIFWLGYDVLHNNGALQNWRLLWRSLSSQSSEILLGIVLWSLFCVVIGRISQNS